VRPWLTETVLLLMAGLIWFSTLCDWWFLTRRTPAPAGVASPGGVVSRSERHPLAVTADTTRRPGGGDAPARPAHDLPCP